MNRQELAERRTFDLRVLSDMRCATFDFEAYRTKADLEARRSRITDREAGAAVTKYRWIFRIPTHISKDKLAQVTEIGVNTDVSDYPFKEPHTQILSSHVPWSPHFLQNAPICLGDEFWEPRQGYITLGELAIHIAHLLNWDEVGRGPTYTGWNPAAIDHHKKAYNGRPINPDVAYPVLPGWLAGDQPPPPPAFQVMDGHRRPGPGFQAHR